MTKDKPCPTCVIFQRKPQPGVVNLRIGLFDQPADGATTPQRICEAFPPEIGKPVRQGIQATPSEIDLRGIAQCGSCQPEAGDTGRQDLDYR